MFVLLMQFVWKYIDDFVGKGLELTIIAELMLYVSLTLVPMALPLAILLASIMTFGNFAENYELSALKSAGISLQKTMRPLVYLTILISMVAFLFANYVMPIANLKMGSLLYDITHQKPALEIREGIFYKGINGYTIRVGRKDKKGNGLYDIMVYDHTSYSGNSKVLVAREGNMRLSEDESFLVLELKNGVSYEEDRKNKMSAAGSFVRASFKEEKVLMDLSDFKMTRTEESLFKDNYQMMNMRQLNMQVDTLEIEMQGRRVVMGQQVLRNMNLEQLQRKEKKSMTGIIPSGPDSGRIMPIREAWKLLPSDSKKQIAGYAVNAARSNESYLLSSKLDEKNTADFINRHLIEWHKKLTLSMACIILFFIGAPLGAIIRKGGIGMPLVVSVIFFLFFYILSITGEKFAREGVMYIWTGSWLANMILFPLGVFLTYKATRDSALFEIDSYFAPFKKLFRRNENPGPVQ